MPCLDAALAIQFDKATLGLTVAVMRDQILANVDSMFDETPYCLHKPAYNVILSEHENHAIPLLQYQAAVICRDDNGMRIILSGKKEATIWAAYRSLMRITLKEVGKRMSVGHVRTGSISSTGSAGSDESTAVKQTKSARVLGLDAFQILTAR